MKSPDFGIFAIRFAFLYFFQIGNKGDFTEEPSLCVYSHNIRGFPKPHRHKVRQISAIWIRTIN